MNLLLLLTLLSFSHALPYFDGWIIQLSPEKKDLAGYYCDHLFDYYWCFSQYWDDLSLSDHDGIIEISPNYMASTATTCQQQPPWHLQQLEQSSVYSLAAGHEGDDVPVYIVDTYLDTAHREFQGRAHLGVSYATGQNDHATHVAGIVASMLAGVSKKAQLISVQVLSGTGQGAYSDILKGLSWVAKQKKGVVNMSIGGPRSQVVTNALNTLWKNGYVLSLAAGNNNEPAELGLAYGYDGIVVAAHDQHFTKASFSNYGRGVTLSAPGVDILSTLPNNQYGYMSGTSMATPMVSGLAATYFANGTTPQQIKTWLLKSATKNNAFPNNQPNKAAQQTFRDAFCRVIKAGVEMTPFFTLQNYG